MKAIGHWSPSYIGGRLKRVVQVRLHPEEPWITRAATDILNQLLHSTDSAVEWGAGRSTLWFAQRLRWLRSVESSPEWYKSVRASLEARGLSNVDLVLSPTKPEYESAARDLATSSQDLAIVDGAFDRGKYALEALRLIKPGGIIIIDDAHRYLPSQSTSPSARSWNAGASSAEWEAFLSETSGWRRIWTSDNVSDTLIIISGYPTEA